MNLEDHYRCEICGTWFNLMEHHICPNCHRPKGSYHCPDCGGIINEYDHFCSHCGTDRRWVTFKCPHCEGEVTAHRKPKIGDDDRFYVNCAKCGNRFPRPDLRL